MLHFREALCDVLAREFLLQCLEEQTLGVVYVGIAARLAHNARRKSSPRSQRPA